MKDKYKGNTTEGGNFCFPQAEADKEFVLDLIMN